MRTLVAIVFCLILAGCVAGCATGPQAPVVKSFTIQTDGGPKSLSYSFWSDNDPTGLNHKGCDLFDNEGKFVTRSSASAPGPVPGLMGQAAQSGAATAVAGGVLPLILGSGGSTSTTNVKVTGTSK